MPRTPFVGADLTDCELEELITRANVARTQFLYDNSGTALKAISWSGIAFGLTLLVLVGLGSPRHEMSEHTAIIEQLATKLSLAERIAPRTLDQVTDLLRRPDYDCRQVECDAWLDRRNAAARAKLEAIVARQSAPATLAASR
jgi:hypothetical protein